MRVEDLYIGLNNQPVTLVLYSLDDATPIDITGWTIQLTIKKNPDDLDAALIVNKINAPGGHTDPTAGKTSFQFTSLDLGSLIDEGLYYLEFQYADDSNQTGVIKLEEDAKVVQIKQPLNRV